MMDQNTIGYLLIATLVGVVIVILLLLAQRNKTKELRTYINGRLTELINLTATANRAQGREEERVEERQRNDIKAAAPDPVKRD